MYFSTTTILAATASILSLAAAAPAQERGLQGAPRVTITAFTQGINNPDGKIQHFDCNLNSLCFSDIDVTGLKIEPGSQFGGVFKADQVECRMYKDGQGLVPGSLPFTTKEKANIATNTVEIGSVLCYIVSN